MNDAIVNPTDEIVIKLLHYFITERGYTPIILHGAQNEIWLENLNNNYEIVRIASNYIHNDEQFDYDLYKTNAILKRIKQKTFSINMNALNIYVNLGENVNIKKFEEEANINNAKIKDISDIESYDFIKESFPDIPKKLTFTEKGIELFTKLTGEINKKGETEAMRVDDVFAKKTPYITYLLMAISIVCFIASHVLGILPNFIIPNSKIAIELGYYQSIVTSQFLHGDLLHLVFNMYALYIIGPQIEGFYGKIKFTAIYIGGGIFGSLMSLVFLPEQVQSLGASGAIFALLGALLYFGYHYRVYLANTMRSQIVPLILINLGFGFAIEGIDNAAHIGGLVGGLLIAIAVGVKYHSTTSDRINGIIMSTLALGFLSYMVFFR